MKPRKRGAGEPDLFDAETEAPRREVEAVRSGQVWCADSARTAYFFVVSCPTDLRDGSHLVVYRPTSGGEHVATDVESFVANKVRVR